MKRVLSIQSHVAYGCVGNRAAVFPLERMGHEVIQMNTVQFSNHTGYPTFCGQTFSASHIEDLFHGIKKVIDISEIDGFLTGYIGKHDIANAIIKISQELKAANPQMIYCLDPVMGDMGTDFFLDKSVALCFKNSLIGYADIITPNLFEASFLSGVEIVDLASAKAACAILHSMGCKYILITSFIVKETEDDKISVLLSCNDNFYIISHPRLLFANTPSGCGDLFSALFLSSFMENKLATLALQKAVNSIYGVLYNTHNSEKRELQIVAAQEELINPQFQFDFKRI